MKNSPLVSFREKLLFTQIYVHVVFLLGLFTSSFSALQIITILAIGQIVFVGGCGTSFFHRALAHRQPLSLLAHRTMIVLSWIGASSSALAWVGHHRMHHQYADTIKDPHSPTYHGIFKTYWTTNGDSSVMRYVTDLVSDKWLLFQHRHYFKGLFAMHGLGLVFLPFSWYWAALIVPAFLMWFAGSSVNVLCHDTLGPRNVPFLGWLHAGEGWHANHHSNPGDREFSKGKDWGYWVHKLLARKNG